MLQSPEPDRRRRARRAPRGRACCWRPSRSSWGKHHARTPEGTAARLALLGPILRQNEAIGVSLRARRTPTDVNPETGEEQPNSPGAAEGPGTAKPNG